MRTFIEDGALALAIQTNKFNDNIAKYATPLGLDAAKLLNFKKSNSFVQFVFNMQDTVQSFAQGFTEYRNQLHFGPSKGMMGELPSPPVFPVVPVPISMGNVRAQFASIIQDCVASENFTRDIGIILGFVKSDSTEKDKEVVVPNLTVKLTTEGHPLLHASKRIYQGYDIYKDSNDGKGYLNLKTSLYPDFIDYSDLPALGMGKTWKYKVIYILRGEHSGTYSAEVTIGVYGLL